VASNELGNDTSNAASLDIQFAPVISKNPEGLTIVEGRDVVLSCVVEGNPSPSVTWTMNGQGLNITANSRLAATRTKNNHNLTITDVHRSDAGQYRCVANNSVDTSTSSAAKVEVYFQPEFISNSENSTVIEGQNIALQCKVYGIPAPDVRWTKDGEAVNIADQRISVSFTGNTSSLKIISVVQADQGLYSCVANNSLNTVTSYPGTLAVHFVPEVRITGAKEQFVIKGRQILLTCQCNALPPVSEVQWEKGGTVIARNTIVEINDSRVDIPFFNESQVKLSINATTPQDAGNYTCLVINDVGNSSDTTSVVIQVEPNPPVNVVVVSKSSRVVNMSWIAGFDGNSAIQNYTVKTSLDNADFVDAVCQEYMSDGSCVVSSTSASVGNLSPWTLYYFKVLARNMVGTSEGSPVVNATTDEEEPGVAPESVTGQNSSSTSILVMWDEVPTDQQNGIITGYTITYKSQTENDNGGVQVNASVRQTELTDLKEYVNYNITVFASTVKGEGPASDPIVVRTDQDKPESAPQNVMGQDRNSTSILVTWDEVPADQQNGIITGYTITYQSQTENDNDSVPAGAEDREKELTGLKEFVIYNITVFASTVKGDGPASDPVIVVRTGQNKPDGAPQNVRGQNSSSTSILVMWDEVPADKQNGFITGYTITYHSQTENDNGSVLVGANDRQKNLTELKEYVNYNMAVFASTVKGNGPANDPVIVVRTDQDSKQFFI